MIDKKIHVVEMINALPYGGAERCLIDIINNCDPDKFRFTLMVFKDNLEMKDEIKRKDVEIVLVPKKGRIGYGFISDIKKELSLLKPDVVHTHLFIADFWGRIAARKLNIPVVTTEHNFNLDDGWMRNRLKRLLRNYSSAYASTSEAIKMYMEKEYHIKDANVIRCGVDLEKFSDVPDTKIQEPFRFVMIGRLTKQKGHEVALNALKKIADYNWHLDIVGAGELRNNLEEMTKKFGLKDKVSFLNPTRDIPKVFASNQILLMPSLWEGLGIVIMEAMAAGRLVIGSKIGGIPELISDKKTGFLVQSNDVEVLALQIEWCFENQDLCSDVASSAREYALKNFGVDNMAKKYADIFLDVVKNKIV